MAGLPNLTDGSCFNLLNLLGVSKPFASSTFASPAGANLDFLSSKIAKKTQTRFPV